ATSIFGFSSAETIGRPFENFCKVPTSSGMLAPADPMQASNLLNGRVLELVGTRKSGETFALEMSLSSWSGIDGYQCGIILRDISVRKREQEHTHYLAMHDSLTGLLNRAGLRSALSEALDAERGSADRLALILIDLDHFKNVNDTRGHQAGDAVLRQVA